MRTEMTVDVTDSTFREALSKLRGGAGVLPWTVRRELGLALGEALAIGTATDAALTLAHQLAADPKWEVRSAVADLLPMVPDDEQGRAVCQRGSRLRRESGLIWSTDTDGQIDVLRLGRSRVARREL